MKNDIKNEGERENDKNMGLPDKTLDEKSEKALDENKSLASDGPISESEADKSADLSPAAGKGSSSQ